MTKLNIRIVISLIFLTVATSLYSQKPEIFWRGGFGGEYLYKTDTGYLYIGYRYRNYTNYETKDIVMNKFGYYIWDTKGKANYTLRKQILIPGNKIAYNFSSEEFTNTGKIHPPQTFFNSKLKRLIASSSLTEKIKNRSFTYKPDNLFNIFYSSLCLENTLGFWNFSNPPWVEGDKGDGTGEFIDIEFSEPIQNLSILNGYVDVNRMNLYYENNRAAKMEIIDLQNNKSYTLPFEDYVYFNNIRFDIPTDHIRLIIKKVYKGTKYNDCCITGMRYEIFDSEPDHKEWIEGALKEFKRN